jgi:hypothetical protein
MITANQKLQPDRLFLEEVAFAIRKGYRPNAIVGDVFLFFVIAYIAAIVILT